MGKGIANPTAMILSVAMMLDWLAERHDHAPAADAARRIERAVDQAFAGGVKPCEFGGPMAPPLSQRRYWKHCK